MMNPTAGPAWGDPLEDTFDLEDSDDIIGVAKHLIDSHHPGVLTTVDESGRPHARWMATLSFDDYPRIYTLTAPDSRKLQHVARHPMVNWMFSNQDLSLIVNITGHARVLDDKGAVRHVWKMIEDKSHAYFLANFSARPGFAVLQTTAEVIECCIPRSNLRWTMDVEALAPARPRKTGGGRQKRRVAGAGRPTSSPE